MKTEYYGYKGKCLCPLNGEVPEGCVKAADPFFPLVFLRSGDPLFSRAAYSVKDIREVSEPDGPGVLCALPESSEETDILFKMVKEKGARAVNTSFPRYTELLDSEVPYFQNPVRINIVGLGDVGGIMAAGLRLLGGGTVNEIGLYDPDMRQCLRYEQELNQILPANDFLAPRVNITGFEELFNCDLFVFAASAGVPSPGEANEDVRMAQLKRNLGILLPYAKAAREKNFRGLFAVVSDPVDYLCRAAFLAGNKNYRGELDMKGLFPEQIRGFGLGVMAARALYSANKRGLGEFSENGRVYGPHGKGLIAANDYGYGYDAGLSKLLTNDAVTANLKVRETGFKPYIAPALSSACIPILKMQKGEWHDSAVPLGGLYFGCRSRLDENGIRAERLPLHPELLRHIQMTYTKLKESFDELL